MGAILNCPNCGRFAKSTQVVDLGSEYSREYLCSSCHAKFVVLEPQPERVHIPVDVFTLQVGKNKVPMTYADSLTEAMTWLAEKPDTVFLGQGVIYGGHAMFKTLAGVPMEKRIELPVAEDMQLGMSIGMALTGKTVISIFPRMDFLMCAMNQLLHLDKLEDFTHFQYRAHVIIRVGIGSTDPLYPGVQHCSDYTDILRAMLKRTPVVKIEKDAMNAYLMAWEADKAVIVEDMNGMV